MFTYTKRELNLLVLCFVLVMLLIYNLVLFPLINQFLNQQTYSKNVYSKIISINENTKYFETQQNQFNICITDKLVEKNSKTTVEVDNYNKTGNNIEDTTTTNKITQRSIIEENKNIKWRIQIPKLNLDVHIVEGTTAEVLLKAVGHFENTAKWNGNVGLAAHNRGYNCNFFEKIKQLKIGDEIIYITTNGKKVYKVQTNKVIQDTDWSYLKQTNDNRITLITCEENREQYRRCVQAVEIANYKV